MILVKRSEFELFLLAHTKRSDVEQFSEKKYEKERFWILLAERGESIKAIV